MPTTETVAEAVGKTREPEVIPAGEARSSTLSGFSPRKERGDHLDCGRRHLSPTYVPTSLSCREMHLPQARGFCTEHDPRLQTASWSARSASSLCGLETSVQPQGLEASS